MDTDGDKSLCLEEFRAGQKKPARPAGKKFQPKRVKSAVKESAYSSRRIQAKVALPNVDW